MKLEEKYVELLAIDESLADEFLLNHVKAQILKELLSNTQEETTETTTEKDPVRVKSSSMQRAEVIAQLEDLGADFSTKDSTRYLKTRLNKTLEQMGLSSQIAPKKAECENKAVTKAPEKQTPKDIIKDIINEANACEDEEDIAYALSATTDDDW